MASFRGSGVTSPGSGYGFTEFSRTAGGETTQIQLTAGSSVIPGEKLGSRGADVQRPGAGGGESVTGGEAHFRLSEGPPTTRSGSQLSMNRLPAGGGIRFRIGTGLTSGLWSRLFHRLGSHHLDSLRSVGDPSVLVIDGHLGSRLRRKPLH
jgi:hypothetical protein